MQTYKDPDFRDFSALHHQMIHERKVPSELVWAWEVLNEQIELIGGIAYPPPWAYHPYGRLLETPSMPNTLSFYAEPMTPIDKEELIELLNLHELYGTQPR